MSRTLPAVVSTAIELDATAPVYLIEMGFSTAIRAATWDEDISWNSQTWSASGAMIKGLSASGARMRLPTGEGDPWLALVLNENVVGKSISIYEHHDTDAVLIFTGVMDELTITSSIDIRIIESSRAKAFPALSADQPTFTHLMTSGDTIVWGNEVITVN